MFAKKQPPVSDRGRNRPPVSSASRNSAVFSYHANRSAAASRERLNIQAQEAQKQKDAPKRLPRGIRRLKAAHFLSATVVLVVFLLCIGLQSTPKIIIVGDKADRFMLADSKIYQKSAQSLLSASWFNNNKLTIDTSRIASHLQEQYPELRTVSVSLPFLGRQPNVYVQPAHVQLVLASPSGQYVVDSSGRALKKLEPGATLREGGKTPLVQDKSGIPFKEGELVLPSSSVAFITEVTGQLQAKEIAIESWSLPAGASELDIKIAGVPYFVKFNLQGSAREQAGAFLATKKHLENSGVTPSQYYDVRVSGRAYYL